MKPTACFAFTPLLLGSFAAALVLCCFACPQKSENKPPSPSVGKEEEPNNLPGQAKKITYALTLEAEISVDAHQRDEDWFWLPAVSNRWAHVEAMPSPGVDLALEVVSPEGEVLSRTNRAGLGGAESISNVGLFQPRFFRVVSAKDGSGGSYQLKVAFVDAALEHEAEPNNRPSEAVHAPLDTPQQGTLADADDADWFRFEMPAPLVEPALEKTTPEETAPLLAPTAETEMPTETTPAPERLLQRIAIEVEADASAALDIQLCDGEAKPLLATRPGHKGSWSVRNYTLPPNLSSVTLVVKPSPAAAFPLSYGLKLSLEKNNLSFEAEPNDVPLQATPLPPLGDMEALLSPPADVDYFRVDVPQASLVNVELSALEGVDLQLSAVVPANTAAKEAERVLLRSNEGKIQEAERLLDVYCEETCFFKVESVAQKISEKWTKTQENPKAPYQIRAQFQEDMQRREREPNNAWQQATELAMGQSVRGHVYPKADVDFFRVDFSQSLVRRPLLATLFGLPKNNLGLWLHRLDEAGKLELVQTAPLPKKEGPTSLRYSASPGVYFLEVKDAKKRASNFQDEYQLRVDLDNVP